jgi:predicted metalloprotease with PDZ domain
MFADVAARRVVAFVLLSALAFGTATAQAPKALVLTLQPGPLKQTDDIDAGSGVVDVTMTIPNVQAAVGVPLFKLPRVVANVETIALTLKDLVVRDGFGEVPLAARDVKGPDGPVRQWSSTREVQGDLVIHYQAPIDNKPPARGAAPPYSLRTEGGGFSGVGNVFLLLPEGDKSYPLSLRWDLSKLIEGSTATSSYGEGDLNLPNGAPARLWSTVFMAGPMTRVPAEVAPHGFSSAWLGAPSPDPAPLMEWAGKLHQWMNGFFGDGKQAPPYRVFLRYNPINAGGGAALTQSFVITHGKGVSSDDLKITLSHEMAHTWTEGVNAAWYDEGIAVHYQALAPFRAGLMSAGQFLDDLNHTAARYYSDALNTTPDAEIMPRFWEDTRIRTLPYDRGALYFAVVDARIRKASGGKRSLDDLVLEMNKRRAAKSDSKAADMAALWPQLLVRELGPPGTALHEAMLAGEVIVPESDDFGPCFKRTTKKVRRFELGFEPASLVGDVKTIRGLRAGGEAAKAGLRDGDVVTYAVAMDKIQGEQDTKLTLNVTRDGRRFPITYLPRGERVQVWQWQRVPGVADSDCRL